MNIKRIVANIVLSESDLRKQYMDYFKKKMDKYNVDSPADFKDEKKKKEFFDDVDKGWKSEDEKKASLLAQNTFEDEIEQIENSGGKIVINRSKLFAVIGAFANYIAGNENDAIMDLRRFSKFDIIKNKDELSSNELESFVSKFDGLLFRKLRNILSQSGASYNRQKLSLITSAFAIYLGRDASDGIKHLKVLKGKLDLDTSELEDGVEPLIDRMMKSMVLIVSQSI